MKIKITGSSGYLGQNILESLKKGGHETSGIDREILYENENRLTDTIQNTDVIINLAGAPILQRWTEKNKQIIYDSRVKTTLNLIESIKKLPVNNQPKKIIGASAIGIYAPGNTHTEKSTDYEKGFVGKVVQNWESASEEIPDNVQRVLFRIAPVLGKKSATVKNLMIPFKLGVGGKIGSGKQPFPFVHIDDVVNAFIWAVEDYEKDGIFNLSAPDNISNKTFTKTFADKINRPAFIPVPGFGLKLIYGEAANMLIDSPEVIPQELERAGYKFRYPDIDSTLSHILK